MLTFYDAVVIAFFQLGFVQGSIASYGLTLFGDRVFFDPIVVFITP